MHSRYIHCLPLGQLKDVNKAFYNTMDVDLLRPGTVPISPDTILWFEFLLDPDLLKKHLAKDNPGTADSSIKFQYIGITYL